MSVLDDKIVRLGFDGSNFKSGVTEAMGLIERLRAKLNFDDVTNAATSAFDTMLTTIKDTVLSVTSTVTNAISDVVESLTTEQFSAGFTKYEEKLTSVKTIMAATGDTLETVSEKMDELMWYTDETSYSFTDMANNIGKFTANGVSLDDATEAMEGISNWAARSGQGVNQAAIAMYNLSQAMGVGGLKLADWKSIENANMATEEFKETALETAAAMGYLEKQADGTYNSLVSNVEGITAANFRNSLSDTGGNMWFTSDVITETLKAYSEFSTRLNEIVNETDVEATTWMQVIDDWTGSAEDWQRAVEATGLSAEELSPIIESLTDDSIELSRASFKMAQESTKWSESLAATQDAASSAWMRIFEDVVGDYTEAKELWTTVTSDMWEIFVKPIDELRYAFDEWAELGGRTELWDAFLNIETGLFSFTDQVWSALDWDIVTADDLMEVTDVIYDISDSFVTLIENGSVTKWAETIKGILHTIKNVADDLWSVLKPIFDALNELNLNTLDRVADYLRMIFGVSADPSQHDDVIAFEMEYLELANALETAAENAGGLIKALGNNQSLFDAITDTFENLFTMAIQAGTAVATFINDFVSDNVGSWREVVDWITEVIEIFNKLATMAGQVMSSIWNIVSPVLSGIGESILIVVDYIKDLLDEFTSSPEVQSALDDFESSSKEIGETIKGWFDDFNADLPGTLDTIRGAIEDIIDFVKSVFSGDIFGEDFDITKTFDTMASKIKNSKFAEVVTSIWTKITSAFGGEGEDSESSSIIDFFKGIGESISDFIDDIDLPSLSDIFDTIEDALDDLSDLDFNLLETLGDAFDFIGGILTAIGPAVADAGKAFADGIGAVFTTVSDNADIELDEESGIFAQLGAFIKGLGGNVAQKLKDVGNAIGDFLAPALDKLAPVLEKIKSIGGSVFTTIGKIFSSLGNGIAKMLQNTGTELGTMSLFDIFDEILKFLNSLSVSSIAKSLKSISKLEGITNLAKELTGLSGVNNALKTIKEIVTTLKTVNKTTTSTVKLSEVTKLIAVIAAVVAELLILATYDAKDILKAIAALTAVAGIFVAFEKIMASSSKLNAKQATGKTITSLSYILDAGAIAILAGAVADLVDEFGDFAERDISWENLGKAGAASVSALVELIGAFALISFTTKSKSSTKSFVDSISTLNDANAFKTIAKAIGNLMDSFSDFAEANSETTWENLGKAGAASIAALGEILLAFEAIDISNNKKSTAKSFVNSISTLNDAMAFKVIGSAISNLMESLSDFATEHSETSWADLGKAGAASVAALGEILIAFEAIDISNGKKSTAKSFVDSISTLNDAMAFKIIGSAIGDLMDNYSDFMDHTDEEFSNLGTSVGASIAALATILAAFWAIELIEGGNTATETFVNSVSELIAANAFKTIADAIEDMMDCYDDFMGHTPEEMENLAAAIAASIAGLAVLITAFGALELMTFDSSTITQFTNILAVAVSAHAFKTIADAISEMTDIFDAFMESGLGTSDSITATIEGISAILVGAGTLLGSYATLNAVAKSNDISDVIKTTLAVDALKTISDAITSILPVFETFLEYENLGNGDTVTATIEAMGAILVGAATLVGSYVALNAAVSGQSFTDEVKTFIAAGTMSTIADAIEQTTDIFGTFMDRDLSSATVDNYVACAVAVLGAMGTLVGTYFALNAIVANNSVGDSLKAFVAAGTLSIISDAISGTIDVFNGFPADTDYTTWAAKALAVVVALAIMILGLKAIEAVGGGSIESLGAAVSLDLMSAAIVGLAAALQMIEDIGIGEMAAKLGIFIGTMALMGGIAALLSPFTPAIIAFAAGMDLLALSALGIGYAMKLMADAIATVVGAISDFLNNGDTGSINDSVSDSAASLGVAVDDATGTVDQAADDMVQSYIDIVEGAADDVYEIGMDIVSEFAAGVDAGAINFQLEGGTITNIQNAISSALTDPLENFVAQCKKTGTSAMGHDGIWYSKVKSAGENIIRALESGLQETKFQSATMTAVAQQVYDECVINEPKVRSAGKYFHDKLEEGFNENPFNLTAIDDLIAEFAIVSGDTATIAENAASVTYGMSFWTAGYNSATNWTNGFCKTLSDAIELRIRGAFESVINVIDTLETDFFNKGRKAGSWIVEGILAGINENKSKVIDAIKALANDSETSFNEELEIESPSKVFKRSGQWIVKGLAEGISDTAALDGSMAKLQNKAKTLADSISDTLESEPIVLKIDTSEAEEKVEDLAYKVDDLNYKVNYYDDDGNIVSSDFRTNGITGKITYGDVSSVERTKNGAESAMTAASGVIRNNVRSQIAAGTLANALSALSNGEASTLNLTVNNQIQGNTIDEVTNEVKRKLSSDLKKKGALWGI